MNSSGPARPTPSARPARGPAKLLAVVLLSVTALAAAACSDTEPAQVSPPPAPEPPPPPAAAEPSPPPAAAEPPPADASGPNDLPAVDVVDVVSGDSIVLSSLAPADRPILLWFWAPH